MEIPKNERKDLVLNITLAVTVIVFFIGVILGKFGPVFIANIKCYKFLGCNAGFFGYDAVLHFVSGILDATAIVVFFRKFPKLSLFHLSFASFWKNLVIIAALTALISLSWEIGEFSHDQFRINVLHENIVATNHLDQPSDADTMGDMTFAEIASILTALLILDKNRSGRQL